MYVSRRGDNFDQDGRIPPDVTRFGTGFVRMGETASGGSGIGSGRDVAGKATA